MRLRSILSSMRRPSPDRCPAPSAPPAAPQRPRRRSRALLPYLWEYRWRVVLALAFLVGAKLANVGVPLLMKDLVDALDLKPGDPRGAAGGAGRRCCWPTARCACRPRCSPSCASSSSPRSRSARRAQHRAARCSATCTPVAALPPRAPDRRHDARHRARHARRSRRCSRTLFYIILPTLIEFDAGARAAGGEVRLPLRRDHVRRAGGLHHLHDQVTEWRTQFRQRDERARLERPTRARSTRCSTTRRSSTSTTRSSRRGATTRTCEQLRARGGQVADLAVAAQHRPELIIAVAVTLPCCGAPTQGVVDGHADARRPGAGQRAADPALHPAQLPRRGLPRDQAVADRHGQDVPRCSSENREVDDAPGAPPLQPCTAARALRARELRLRAGAARSCTT